MEMPDDQPRQWVALTVTLAADTKAELDEAIEHFADEAFLWQQQPVGAFTRQQREVHVGAMFGTPEWVECP